ncbi:MAG: hypothetical protein WKF92_12380 [Pyrinomonadaceae bacterium]
MGLFEKLKSSFSTGALKKEQIERLRESIWTAIADGHITDQELEYINGFYRDSELSQEEFNKLRSEIFSQVVQQAIIDRRVDASELAVLNHLIERLQVAPEVEAWAGRQIQYYSLYAQIESGAPLPVGSPTGLILQKNELCHASLAAQLIEERVVSRNYAGGSHGVNLRIVKGVSYRIGQQKGKMVSQSGLIPVSDGYFVVTNKRLVFTGDRKSVSTPIEKLLDLHIFSDGLNFTQMGKVKPIIVRLNSNEESELCALLISRLINEI